MKCGEKGHISKLCRQCRDSPKTKESKSAAWEIRSVREHSAITPGIRMVLRVVIDGNELEFLYDPRGQFSIIPRQLYEQFKVKPPLVPVNEAAVGVAGNRLEFDGVVYTNVNLVQEDGSYYLLEYEPLLVTSAVDSCIFGIHTEQ